MLPAYAPATFSNVTGPARLNLAIRASKLCPPTTHDTQYALRISGGNSPSMVSVEDAALSLAEKVASWLRSPGEHILGV
jgi:hypothetical protein